MNIRIWIQKSILQKKKSDIIRNETIIDTKKLKNKTNKRNTNNIL